MLTKEQKCKLLVVLNRIESCLEACVDHGNYNECSQLEQVGKAISEFEESMGL